MTSEQRPSGGAFVLEGTTLVYYYALFESTAEGVGVGDLAYYQKGLDRMKKAVWNGTAWVNSYLAGTSDPTQDPFIKYEDVDGKRVQVGVRGIAEAEYRPGFGTDLYVKTKWGGSKFWLDDEGNPRPEYQGWPTRTPGVQFDSKYYYQYPLRVFNSQHGWSINRRLFADHSEWEVRGVTNFTLIPNAHPSMRAYAKVPKFAGRAYENGDRFDLQYAIGADYLFGEALP
jgi:hypothetical protein